MTSIKRSIVFTLAFAMLPVLSLYVVAPAPAFGQYEHLNVDRLIKGLRERNMYELLVHLSTSGAIKNPADAKKLEIEMHVLQATRLYGDPATRAEAQSELEQGITGFRDLIKGNRDEVRRPTWQADMALHLLYTRPAMNMNAGMFYEFGIPSPAQKKLFEDSAVSALQNLTDASLYLRSLENRLPREDDFNEKYVNTGLWEELINEYKRTKLPFFLSQAAYGAALLPNANPYYQSLGNNRFIPMQKSTPVAERKRLYEQAIDELTSLRPEMRRKFGLPDRLIELIRGKAMIGTKNFDESISLLDEVYNKGRNDLQGFQALLAKGLALAGKNPKDPQVAVEFLEAAKDHPLVAGEVPDPLLRIIIADLEHRILLKAAKADKEVTDEELAAAYAPYDDLLGDKRLRGALQQVRVFVFKRWIEIYKGVTPDKLPPMVLVGMAEMERISGQNLVSEAFDAQAGEVVDKDKMAKAKEHLGKCIDICDSLINRGEDAPVAVRARAMYNKAWSRFLTNPNSPAAMLAAADVWSDIVPLVPKNPLALESMGFAMRMVSSLHANPGIDFQGLDEAYEKVAGILFEHLPDSKIATDERVYWTFNILQKKGKFSDAIKSYQEVPPSHPDYLQAQREFLFCRLQLYRDMETDKKATEVEKLAEEATRVLSEARDAIDSAPTPEARAGFRRTIGDVTLTLVDLNVERKKWGVAQQALQNLVEDYDDAPDLIQRALSKQVVVLVKQGEADKAVAVARKLMEMAGDDDDARKGAAATIDNVLVEIADEIESLRTIAAAQVGDLDRKKYEAEAQRLAQASLQLANMLLDWAASQKLAPDDQFRYRTIQVRSLLLTGQLKAAEKALRPLLSEYAGDGQVLLLQGENLYHAGTKDGLKKAIYIYDKITSDESMRPQVITPSMNPKEQALRKAKNRLWWMAWLRRLQIHDKLQIHTEQIPRMVKQLESQYSGLGGLVVRRQLLTLKNKYK